MIAPKIFFLLEGNSDTSGNGDDPLERSNFFLLCSFDEF